MTTRICIVACLAVLAGLRSAATVAAEAGKAVVVHLSFDQGKGGWAMDSSPAENNGMLGQTAGDAADDPRWAANGKEGGALEFDGVNDVVLIAHTDSLNFVRGIIVEAWILQRTRTAYARVLDRGPCFDVYIHENGTPSFRFHGAEAHGVRGKQPIPLNEWVHLKASYDGTRMTLFVNGKEVARRAYGEPIPNRTNDLRIGGAQNGRPFHGLIDGVRIVNMGYEHPVVTAYDADAETVGLWHFDTAERAKDAGPNQLHGVIHGAEFVPGKLGMALKFDGDDYVRIPHHPALDLAEELTIDCWVKQIEPRRWARVVDKSGGVYALWIDGNGGRADFFYRPFPDGYSHTVSGVAMLLHRWVHLRAEFDGVESVVYFDGKEVARRDVPPEEEKIAISTGGLLIGNRAAIDRGFVGLIDELRISRVARTTRPPIAVKIIPFPSDDRWAVAFNAQPLRKRSGSLRWKLKHLKTGKTCEEAHIRRLRRGFARTSIDISKLHPGEYALSAVALDGNEKELARTERRITKPERPAWLEAKIGITDEVPPPWTAIGIRGQKSEVRGQAEIVEVVLREYGLGASGLPTQVVSQGKELLAGPVELKVAGKQFGWTRKLVERKPGKVVWESKADAPGLAARMRTTLEFDGMMRFDLSVNPGQPIRIEPAYLDVPLVAEHATLMHHPAGRWFKEPTCAGAVPKDGWSVAHTWYLWLGDEDRGLCWFAEDQEAWGLDGKRPGIEIVRDGEAVRLRVWLVNSAAELAEPRNFTFGLMATPAKPLPKGWQRWRFGSPNAPVTVGVRWSTLQTSKWHSFPVPPNPDWYHAQVTKAHQEGKKFIPYTNFNMQSNTGPDWDYWGEEWNGHAGKGLAADVLAMDVENIRCCAMTPSWCDFIVWKYKRFIEEYGSDGFYLDNSSPGRCNNPAHPAHHHKRRHIFAARELMKRFYTVTKQNDPGNVMVCHMSSRLCIPVLSFCDAIVDGEQYGWALKEGFDGHYISITPPARVRAELMGRQWGLIPLFLPCNRGPNRWNRALMRELLALMLPHGTRFWLGGHRQTMQEALDVVDGFGIDDARFVPYWAEPTWRRLAEERRILVSAYVKEKEIMLILSNLADSAQPLALSLDSPMLGRIAPPLNAADRLDKLPVSLRGRSLSCSIGPRDMRILTVMCPDE